MTKPIGHLHSNGDFCQDRLVTEKVSWPVKLYSHEEIMNAASLMLGLWAQYAGRLRHDWMGAGEAAGEWLESLGLVVDVGGEVELTEAGRKLLGRK